VIVVGSVRVADLIRGATHVHFFNRDFVLRVVDLYHGTDFDTFLGFFGFLQNKTVGTMPAAAEHHRHKSIQLLTYYLVLPK
jgi:hypothetical protein